MLTMNDSLVIDATESQQRLIRETLAPYGAGALAVAARFGGRIVVLRDGECYDDRSPMLRRMTESPSRWPLPPAGLFVVQERTIYLRSLSPMTIAHEAAHLIDASLGGGVYRSGIDPLIRRAFAAAENFVTPYAASACDEYFAESVRAFISVNDSHSLWPKATRERLWEVDPRMAAIVTSLFENELDPGANP